MMPRLNFPDYEFRITEKEGKLCIFDPARKKYVSLTPEEWVRQHVIRFLIMEKQVPVSLIAVESEISLFKTKKRVDAAVFDRNGKPLILVECKAPIIAITQDVMDQAVRYNISLQVAYLMLTNGLQHICFRVDLHDGQPRLIPDLPSFKELT